MVTAPVLVIFTIGLSALITGITVIEVIVGEVYNGPFKQVLVGHLSLNQLVPHLYTIH